MRILLFPITKWHLYGMYAYLQSVFSSDEFDSLYIEIYAIKHGESGYLLSQDDVIYKNASFKKDEELSNSNFSVKNTMRLLFGKKSHHVLAICVHNTSIRKIMNSIDRSDFKKTKLDVVLVDDGIGSYFSKKVWRMCARNESKHYFRDCLKRIPVNFFNTLYKANHWHMAKIVQGKIVSCHGDAYLQVIKDDMKRYHFENYDSMFNLNSNKPVALFLTQPWSETNQLQIDEELEIINSCINLLHSRFNVCIKSHPREKEDKYSCCNARLLGNRFPAEFYLSSLGKDDIVIGYNSTALISSSIIFGLKTFSVINLLDLKTKDNMMNTACSEFTKMTEGIIDYNLQNA